MGKLRPDGTSRTSIYTQALDGGSEPDAVTPPPLVGFFVYDWSPDGRFLVFGKPLARSDLWVASHTDRAPRQLTATPHDELAARFSPDGKWLAYSSDQSCRVEVYVRPSLSTGDQIQISSDGGSEPVWSRDGSEIYFRAPGNQMMVLPFRGGVPTSRALPLIRGVYLSAGAIAQYDVARDGRFLMIKPMEQAAGPSELVLVQNWFEELQRKIPAQ
jgi:dipeptidyl aminopeptidase/acylaminoacyl peptidase